MPEIVGAFAFRELGEEFADLGPQSRDRSFGGLTQQGLELGEGHFDGIEVRRIGREVQKFRAGRFDQCAHGEDLVNGQVVHDDDVAGYQRRNQELNQPGHENFAIHRLVDDQRRGDGVLAQTRHEGCRLPVAVRRVSNEAFAALAASAQARHRRVGSGLVDENEPVGIKRRLFALPLLASRRHVGAQLLRRAKAFF